MPDIELTSAEMDCPFRIGDRVRITRTKLHNEPDWLSDWREPLGDPWQGYVVGLHLSRHRNGDHYIDVTVTEDNALSSGHTDGFEPRFLELVNPALARSGLEARKAEESMRERAALEAEEYHVHSVAAAIRALPLTEGGDKP